MLNEFTINLVAGVALIFLGFVSRQLVTLFRTRATRRIWRGLHSKSSLTITLSAKPGRSPEANPRASFDEVRVLTSLIPTLIRLRIEYSIVDSTIGAARNLTSSNLLIIGGPNSNEVSREALRLLAPLLSIEIDREGPGVTVDDRHYAPQYGDSRTEVCYDYGFIIRAPNPFSSNPSLSATLIMGFRGIGTAGAAQALTDEILARKILDEVGLANFVIVVGVRPIGSERLVKIEHFRVIPT